MNWLKRIGTVVLKIVGIASGLMPLISPALGSNSGTAAVVVDKLDTAATAVITAQQMFTAAFGPDASHGSDKLKAATPFVGALLQSITHVAGKKPKDEAKAEAAIAGITSNLADFLASYGD